MIAAGIDLGGTKSELQVFDESWNGIHRIRANTPTEYDALLQLVAGQVRYALEVTGAPIPVGIGVAGLVDAGGTLTAANLVAAGRPFPDDIERSVRHPVTFENDGRAFALSEAVFGAGRNHNVVLALVLGTGVGGGVAVGGSLRRGPVGTGGEFGHIAASASVVARHGLPVHRCGCGRTGCIESYVSGPGLTRLARRLTGREWSPEDLVARKASDNDAIGVWDVWLELIGELLLCLVHTVDPDAIVLGGGLSQAAGITDEISHALSRAQIAGFGSPPILLAEGGNASGTRGAAFSAWQEMQGDLRHRFR